MRSGVSLPCNRSFVESLTKKYALFISGQVVPIGISKVQATPAAIQKTWIALGLNLQAQKSSCWTSSILILSIAHDARAIMSKFSTETVRVVKASGSIAPVPFVCYPQAAT